MGVPRRSEGKKRTAPGALRPEPWRCPGQLEDEHPPMVDQLALAFARPHIARRARRHGGRCRVVGPVAGCPARCRHGALPAHRTNPTRRSCTMRTSAPASQLGWPSGCSGPKPSRTTDRRTGGPPEVARWLSRPVHRRRWRRPLPRQGRDRPSPSAPPGGGTHELGSPVPVGVALSGTEHTLMDASPQVKTCFESHRVLPRTFLLPPGTVRSSTVRAQGRAHLGAPSMACRLTSGARDG